MFGRRKQQWYIRVQSADHPIPLRELTPKDSPENIAQFLRSKIGTNELNGFITPDDEQYIPIKYIQQQISREIATKGYVDICDIIDLTNLPGRLLENQISLNVQNMDGFFDVINRKFYTLQGAKREVRQLLSTTMALDLKYLLNHLFWTEDHLEGILDLLAIDGKFIGYIDPIKQRVYNFNSLNFSSPSNEKKNLKHLLIFIDKCFQLESEASLVHICKLTRLNEEKSLELLRRNRKRINFLFSTDFNYIYPIMDIIAQVLKDIFVYRNIPIKFWLQRLDIDRADFINVITILNDSLKGTLSVEKFLAPSLRNWFENGIDIESLALRLNLKTLELLNRIVELGKLLRLRITAGDTIDPFLVKGVERFDIFCQVDTSSYVNPHLYFECQNCRRIMCSNCRSTGSKHECPFCGNISAFIIDLPRHCSHCNVNYTHSYNLADSEECQFCKKGPLKVGWTEYESIPLRTEKLYKSFSKFLESTTSNEVPLQQIISLLNKSDREVVGILESYILHGIIQGWIDIQNMMLKLVKSENTFLCVVCELSRPVTDSHPCNSCDIKVCLECYNEMSIVGMTVCPECGGILK